LPQTHDPKPDDPKPDGPQGPQRADVELARAYERIKSADEELARLDRVVSGMERGSDSPPIRQEGAAAEPSHATVNKAPPPQSNARQQGLRGKRLMRGGLVGLLLAIGILGAAFASRYGHEAKAIMARWAPPSATAPPEASELRAPARSLAVQVAAADEKPSLPAAPSRKEVNDIPSTGAATATSSTSTKSASTDSTSADVAQSLKTIANDLASINEKLEQLKSSHEQTLRDHTDAIQQLKTAQEQGARDNARITEQVQALQTQLAILSAKSSAPSLIRGNDVAARQHIPVAAPRRPRRPRAPWMPPPDMGEPYYPYW
jgi:MbeD/MobD like